MISTQGREIVDVSERDEQRIDAAIHATTALALEQQRLIWSGDAEQLRRINLLVARGFDEKRRALAGAAAVPEYDPFVYVPNEMELYLDTLQQREKVRLSKRQIQRLKAEYARGEGVSRDELAERYAISRRRVDQIVQGEREGPSTARLKREQVADILRRYRESAGRRGMISALARHYGVQRSTICNIVNRRAWCDVEA